MLRSEIHIFHGATVFLCCILFYTLALGQFWHRVLLFRIVSQPRTTISQFIIHHRSDEKTESSSMTLLYFFFFVLFSFKSNSISFLRFRHVSRVTRAEFYVIISDFRAPDRLPFLCYLAKPILSISIQKLTLPLCMLLFFYFFLFVFVVLLIRLITCLTLVA